MERKESLEERMKKCKKEGWRGEIRESEEKRKVGSGKDTGGGKEETPWLRVCGCT